MTEIIQYFFPLTLFGLHIADSLAFVLCLEWP